MRGRGPFDQIVCSIVFPTLVTLQFFQREGASEPQIVFLAGFALALACGAAYCLRRFRARFTPGMPTPALAVIRLSAWLLGTQIFAAAVLLFVLDRFPAELQQQPVTLGLAILIAMGAYGLALAALLPPRPVHRGRALLTLRSAAARAARHARPGESRLPWGGIRLPCSAASAHFAVVGATGSGKTLTLRLLMQAVLPTIRPGSRSRALVYDAKQDVLSQLAGMNVTCPIHLVHPLDVRGVAWDLAADCRAPATAMQLASILIPAEEGPNRFFTDAARDLLTGALISLHRTLPGQWVLRDLLLVIRDRERLASLLMRVPEVRDRLQYFAEPRTFQNIFSTLAARTAVYEPLAACWDRAAGALSLAGWVQSESILVLGNDESVRTALDALNRAVFQRLTELVLAGPERREVSTWIFLDEVREAGKLEGLGRLLTKGRSKGCAVVLGFQDIEGMREVYGPRVADELVGQCGNKAIPRLENPGTAEWAARMFGDQERYKRSRTHLEDGRLAGKSDTEQLVQRPLVLPSEFLNLPRPEQGHGLVGYYLSPLVGAYRGGMTGRALSKQLYPKHPAVPDYLPRPADDQCLRPWEEADHTRLLLTKSPEDPRVTEEPTAGYRMPNAAGLRLKAIRAPGDDP
jgi:hypothetical protein